MPRTISDFVPTYRLHKPSGRAVVTLVGKDVYLGAYGTPQSINAYNRALAEFRSNRCLLPHNGAGMTVSELIDAFLLFAADYYRNRP